MSSQKAYKASKVTDKKSNFQINLYSAEAIDFFVGTVSVLETDEMLLHYN